MPIILNPQDISNNYRLQSLITREEEKKKAFLLERTTASLSSTDYVNLGLIDLELGDYDSSIEYAFQALRYEDGQSSSWKNKEITATAYYLRGIERREHLEYEMAFDKFKEALNLTKSDWLKVNIHKNIGITYLILEKYSAAAQAFKVSMDLILASADKNLAGSMPALKNYYGLALIRGTILTLKSEKNAEKITELEAQLKQGLDLLAETTTLFKALFDDKQLSTEERLGSHDWQLHQHDRGLILRELAENEKLAGKLSGQAKSHEAQLLSTSSQANSFFSRKQTVGPVVETVIPADPVKTKRKFGCCGPF